MPKRAYKRDSKGQFASTGSSGRTPQGKGAKAAGVELNGKPMTVGAHRAFVRKAISQGTMTKESHKALMQQGKDTGSTISYRTELGPLKKPRAERVTLGKHTYRSTTVTGKLVDGKFVANKNPPKWKTPTPPRQRKKK
jgi:hypothetical protein